jgi:tRNA threonylcarbamoyladenosine biosynthesis protein TsaE
MKKIISNSTQETQQLAIEFAQNIKAGDLICFQGELGAGKTTFIQTLLAEFKAKKPYTSPTFVIMKEYLLINQVADRIYHFDAYRIDETSLQDLSWQEIINDKKVITFIEWPEQIKTAIPKKAKYVIIEWLSKNKRQFIFE